MGMNMVSGQKYVILFHLSILGARGRDGLGTSSPHAAGLPDDVSGGTMNSSLSTGRPHLTSTDTHTHTVTVHILAHVHVLL